MSDVILDAADGQAIPVHAVTEAEAPAALDKAPATAKAFAAFNEFTGKSGQLLLTPGADGALSTVLFGLGEGGDPMAFRALAAKLPAGSYRISRMPKGLARSATARPMSPYPRMPSVRPRSSTGMNCSQRASACWRTRRRSSLAKNNIAARANSLSDPL